MNPLLAFDYKSFCASYLSEYEQATRFGKWLRKHQVATEIYSNPVNHFIQCPHDLSAAELATFTLKPVDYIQRQKEAQAYLVRFRLHEEVGHNLVDIRQMFRDINVRVTTREQYIPDHLWLHNLSNSGYAQNTSNAADWRCFLERSKKEKPFEVIAVLTDDYEIRKITSHQHMANIGNKISICFHQLVTTRPEQRYAGVKFYEEAMLRGELQYLKRKNGPIEAVWCLYGNKIVEIAGEYNNPLGVAAEKRLMGYFKKKGIRFITYDEAIEINLGHCPRGYAVPDAGLPNTTGIKYASYTRQLAHKFG